MEDFVNKEHDYNNQNGTDAKINNMNEGERTLSDITPPAMVVEYEDTKHKDKSYNETETDMITLDK